MASDSDQVMRQTRTTDQPMTLRVRNKEHTLQKVSKKTIVGLARMARKQFIQNNKLPTPRQDDCKTRNYSKNCIYPLYTGN